MIVNVNRMAGLDDPEPAKAVRTKAQKKAARQNGSKSRGPKTAGGKARSRENALKHGFTAKHLVPPSDPRHDDRLYKRFHRALAEEFVPRGFTATSLVSNLAHDHVQLVRCRRMIEEVQRPAHLAQSDQEKWEDLEQRRLEHGLALKAMATIDAGDDLDFTVKQARVIAKLICGIVDRTADDIAELDDDDPDFDDAAEEFDPEAVEEIRRIWDLIHPMERRLADENHLVEVFSGDALPARGERKRLRGLLQLFEEPARHREWLGAEIESRVSRITEAAARKVAFDPQRIMLLGRYLGEIERAIERKVKQLREM